MIKIFIFIPRFIAMIIMLFALTMVSFLLGEDHFDDLRSIDKIWDTKIKL